MTGPRAPHVEDVLYCAAKFSDKPHQLFTALARLANEYGDSKAEREMLAVYESGRYAAPLGGREMSEEVKSAMTRRMNAMFAALSKIEWAGGTAIYPACPACGNERRFGHRDVDAPSLGKDSVTEPCPLAFALSEDAYRYGEAVEPVETRRFPDGSRFLHRAIPVRARSGETPAQQEEGT